MIEFATIARPYAKALYELAQEKQQTQQWLDGLALLSSIMQQSEVVVFIGRVDVSADDKADELLRLLEGSEAVTNPDFRNFLHVVANEKRLDVLSEIFAQYQDMVLAQNHEKQAIIYTAYDIASEGQRAKIISDLEQHFQVRLQAQFQTDNSLIGGLKIVMNDQVLDLSVQGKLKQLYTTMTS